MIRAMQELRIQQHFIDSADLCYQVSDTLAKPVDAATQALLASVTGGGKVLVAGGGASVVLAQYFAGLLVGGFERERPGLPAVFLTADALSVSSAPREERLSRQVHALGQAGDLLVLVSARGDEPELERAVSAAHEREMMVLAIAGGPAAGVVRRLRETDVHVGVPHERAVLVREVQLLVLHCLCDGIDAQLLGEEEPM